MTKHRFPHVVLELKPNDLVYHLDFTNDAEADRVERAFGTHRLPTPYSADADPRKVWAIIQDNNPRVPVLLGELCIAIPNTNDTILVNRTE